MATLHELIRQARRETHTWLDGELAQLLGCSRRTVQRHNRTGGLSTPSDYRKLIQAVHPKNPDLAAQLAAAIGMTLDALGIEPPAPPPDPTRPEHADSVVCAAADVLKLPPFKIRPAVAAALSKAHELQVTIPGLVKHLSPARAKPKPR